MAKKTVKGCATAGATWETSTQLANAASATVTTSSIPPTFMDIHQVALMFGITPDAIYRSRANGHFFPAVRVAGRLLWRRDLIESGLAEQLAQDEAVLADRRRARLAKRATSGGKNA